MTHDSAGGIMLSVSTQYPLRLPDALHAQLRAHAEEQGVSFNQLCVALLAGAIGFSLEEAT